MIGLSLPPLREFNIPRVPRVHKIGNGVEHVHCTQNQLSVFLDKLTDERGGSILGTLENIPKLPHDNSIGEISLKSEKMFVTSNRSLEYNVDETYYNTVGFAAKNRHILNKSGVSYENFIKIKNQLFPKWLEYIKSSKIVSLDTNKFSGYEQAIGKLKCRSDVLVDITLDTYKNLHGLYFLLRY